jgi:hypothetical protein
MSEHQIVLNVKLEPYLDFAVWLLDFYGIKINPFERYQSRLDNELFQLGLTVEAWEAWFAQLCAIAVTKKSYDNSLKLYTDQRQKRGRIRFSANRLNIGIDEENPGQISDRERIKIEEEEKHFSRISKFIQIVNLEFGLDLMSDIPFFYSRRSVDDCYFIRLLKSPDELNEKLMELWQIYIAYIYPERHNFLVFMMGSECWLTSEPDNNYDLIVFYKCHSRPNSLVALANFLPGTLDALLEIDDFKLFIFTGNTKGVNFSADYIAIA